MDVGSELLDEMVRHPSSVMDAGLRATQKCFAQVEARLKVVEADLGDCHEALSAMSKSQGKMLDVVTRLVARVAVLERPRVPEMCNGSVVVDDEDIEQEMLNRRYSRQFVRGGRRS